MRPWIVERAERTPDRTALEVLGERIAYAELRERAEAFADRLRASGARPGYVLAALVRSPVRFVEALHATDLCGAALLPLNARLAPRELSYQLEDAGARALVRDGGEIEIRRPPQVSRTPRDAFAIVYTSGTTGRPRGAILTRGNFLASATASAFHLGASPDDRWLASLPLYHVGGLAILTRCVLQGAAAILHDRFDASAVDRAIDCEAVTHVSLTATMLRRLLEARGERRAPPTLRCVLLGGGPCPPALVERATKLTFPVAVTYGLTEATSQVATRTPGAPPGAGLTPLPGTDVRIVRGEIEVRGPTVMAGYVGAPAHGGWLRTGDLGFLDDSGGLHVLDRRSDLVISGGENVYPAEVEAVLSEHPGIAEAGVAGVPDPEFGSRPAAWIVPRGAAPSDPELRAFCRERLAGYKVPVAFHVTQALPRNPMGKLLRRHLA